MELCKKISETKDQEYLCGVLYFTLKSFPDTTGDKIPRIG